MRLSHIAALSRNRVIAANNDIPWHIPKDARWFHQKTIGHPVLMGRKTYDSMGNALKGRTNIVITRNPDFAPPDAIVVSTIEAGIEQARGTEGDDELFIIGGETIYRQTLDIADRLYLTHIAIDIEGDTFYPEFDETEWEIIFREPHAATELVPYAFEFVIYQRKPSSASV
jgi:dihydrofolate reductase